MQVFFIFILCNVVSNMVELLHNSPYGRKNILIMKNPDDPLKQLYNELNQHYHTSDWVAFEEQQNKFLLLVELAIKKNHNLKCNVKKLRF